MQKTATCRLVRRSLSTRRSLVRRLVGEGGSALARRSLREAGFLSLRTLVALLFCAAITCSIVITTRSGLAFLRREKPSNASQGTLSFEQRVSYQRAIEDVYWRHRIWPKERKDPKPSLDAVMSQAQIEKKVADYLSYSIALEEYWNCTMSAEQLQAVLVRISSYNKQHSMF